MKKILSLICIMMLCIGMSSCVSSSYAHTNRRCYHTHSVYYKNAHRHHDYNPNLYRYEPRPKHYRYVPRRNPNLYRYEPIPKHHPKPKPHPHHHRPQNPKPDRHKPNRR